MPNIKQIYVWTNLVRPISEWTPDSSRTLLYLKLNNNTTDSSWNSVTVNNSGISYGTIGNNYYAQLTSTTGYITPTASLWQQVWAWDFTVSFYFRAINNSGESERPWFFWDWYDSASPWPWICVRWTYGSWTPKISWLSDWNQSQWSLEINCSISTWHYQTNVRKNWVCYCYLDWQFMGQYSNTYNYASPWVNKFYILNRSDYSAQRWRSTWARISEVIFEKVAWTAQDVTNYYNLTKSNYGL